MIYYPQTIDSFVMILYHGSNVEVVEPKIVHSVRTLDFGSGFYTTANRNQAENFALRITPKRGTGAPIVSCYEFDEKALAGCKVKDSPVAGVEWLDFVSDNRNDVYAGLDYDFVHGPIANDDVYRTLLFYFEGLMTKEAALAALKVRKLYNQYVFKSEAALAALHFVGSEVVHG